MELGLGSMFIVNLCNVITNNGSAKPFINDYSPNIQNMVWVLENQYIHANGMTGTGRVGNVKQVLKPENTGGELKGRQSQQFPKHCSFGVNWDIFA